VVRISGIDQVRVFGTRISFLRRFNYEIRSAEGRIVVEPVASA
jgi:hypothetical protein